MMSCKEVAELSSEYLDGDLPRLRRWSLRLHIAFCRECRALVEGIRKIIEASPSLRRPGDQQRYEELATRLTSAPPNPKPDP